MPNHCFLWLGGAWNQEAASAMAASFVLAEHLDAPIQQLPELLCTGNSGELWVLPPVLGITILVLQ